MEACEARIGDPALGEPVHAVLIYAPHVAGGLQCRQRNGRCVGGSEAFALRLAVGGIDEDHADAEQPHPHGDLEVHIRQ